MSYSTDRTDPELDFFDSLLAHTSGETTQNTMPVTPMMGTDVYLTANPAAVNSHFYNPCIDGTVAMTASMSAASAASGQFYTASGKDYNSDSPYICYQQYPSSGGTLPRAIPYPASQPFSPAMTAQPYTCSPVELGAHLHEISMAASGTPPQINVASPELLGIGGVRQLGTGTIGNDFLRHIVHQTHAPTPRLHSQHHAHSSFSDGMGAFLPASTSSQYAMPITGPAQVPAEPLFAPVCYADMSNSGSRRSSSAAAHAAYAPNSAIAAHSRGHIGQHGIPMLSQNNGFLGDGNVFNNTGSLVIGTPVTSVGSNSGAHALSQSFTSVFSDISLGNSYGESQAMPAFANQGVVRNSSRLARMRPGRSLSISEPFHARTPSPALSALGAVPHTSAHPYFPSAAYQSFGGAHSPSMGVAAINQYSGDQGNVYGGAEADKTYSEGEWRHPKSNSSSRLALLRSKSGPQSRPRPRVARSMLGSPSTAAVASVSASIESHSSDEAHSDDERTDIVVKAEQGIRTSSGRTPLTAMQREVFFRWLYQNIHDPKPRGSERDRLRAIGNMSRERFKTWFANARRRYFTVTVENGVQRYAMNNRFIVVCERSGINLHG
ncbi:hypothetical protein GGI03_004540 [Coemansia sp. RSA 2337]|nr:hypothetical protein GGI03_004540 [Coemansia sp. RSA 2337]